MIDGYKKLLYEMKGEGILDPDNPTDVFCLHYVFLPGIKRTLKEFIDAQNNHRVSTEGNNTPSQLFFLNLRLTAIHSGLSSEDTRYGMNVPDFLENNELPHVHVSDARNPLDDKTFEELKCVINPLSQQEGHALFKETVQFIGDRIC